MTDIIPLSFEDFKKVCQEFKKRIYYFQTEDIVDLYFVSEGMFVWSYVDLKTIENVETFFGQEMFLGATKLLFKIPVRDETQAGINLNAPDIVQAVMPVENTSPEDADLQKEGIKDKEPGE